MVSRGAATGALVLVLLATGCSGTDPEPRSSGADGSPPATEEASPGGKQRATPRTDRAPREDEPTPTSTVPTTSAPSGSVGDALEMPAASPSEVVLSDLLPEPRTRPLLRAPLPRRSAARDRLVDDFPGYLRPVRRSSVLGSSLSPSGGRLQVALEALTDLGTDAVLREYRRRLTRLGMREQHVTSAGGSEAMAMRLHQSSLVVTVTPNGDRTSYTVYGTLHARS